MPSMNFQDNSEKVRGLYVVLSFISIKEIALYFLVHYKNMKHYFFYFIILSLKLKCSFISSIMVFALDKIRKIVFNI